jgi:hypothetical protein
MKKFVLFTLLPLTIIVGSATLVYAQVYGAVFRVEYNTDRAGGDLRSGFPASLGQCMNNCASSSKCKAFTWVDVNQQPPNYNNSSPLCWLKHSVTGKRRNSGMVSGVKN